MSNRLINKLLRVASIVFIPALIATKWNLITFVIGVIFIITLLVISCKKNNKQADE